MELSTMLLLAFTLMLTMIPGIATEDPEKNITMWETDTEIQIPECGNETLCYIDNESGIFVFNNSEIIDEGYSWTER